MEFNNEEFVKLNIKLIDFMDDLVRVFDKNGLIVYINESMKKITDDVGKFCNFTNREMSSDLLFSSLMCIDPMGRNDEVITDEIQIGNKYYLVKSSPVFDDNNNYWGSIEVFRDITEEKKMLEDIEKYNAKINKSLHYASGIQKGLLPKKGEMNGIILDYRYISSDELSGDFFDVIEIDKNRTCVYIADVMGHGVAASMITMFIKFSVRSILANKKINSTGDILNALSKEFAKLDLEMYFTIFLGIYDSEKMEFSYSNAGHGCIPVLFDKNVNLLLELSGLPVSWLFKDCTYSEGSIRMRKDDTLFFYTDGLIESKDINREMYGEERLLNLIDENKNLDINILDVVLDSLNKFRHGTQEDDIAILSMKIL